MHLSDEVMISAVYLLFQFKSALASLSSLLTFVIFRLVESHRKQTLLKQNDAYSYVCLLIIHYVICDINCTDCSRGVVFCHFSNELDLNFVCYHQILKRVVPKTSKHLY